MNHGSIVFMGSCRITSSTVIATLGPQVYKQDLRRPCRNPGPNEALSGPYLGGVGYMGRGGSGLHDHRSPAGASQNTGSFM